MAEYTLGTLAEMTVKMSHKFQEQFIGKYLPAIFPYVLNYSCGGPDYPDLFGDWDQESQSSEKRWRRKQGEAFLNPGSHAQMLATRPEAQIAGDWMTALAARSLQWRHIVLRNSFLTCKRKIALVKR